jgi:ABC-type multidrug transport system fused ATPase/permease subunit
MDHGQIIEEGTHDQLMAQSGHWKSHSCEPHGGFLG